MKDYPKYLYRKKSEAPGFEAVLIASEKAEYAIESELFDSPAEFGIVTHPAEGQVVEAIPSAEEELPADDEGASEDESFEDEFSDEEDLDQEEGDEEETEESVPTHEEMHQLSNKQLHAMLLARGFDKAEFNGKRKELLIRMLEGKA